jgi:cell division protein FtsQ
MNWNKLKNIAGWVAICTALAVSMGFAYSVQQNMICTGIKVKIDYSSNMFFIDEKDVLQTIENNFSDLKGRSMNSINIAEVEQKLYSNYSIKNADVYKTIDGYISVEIKQRTPVLRIFTENNFSFYIDEFGKFMPLSNKFTSRVTVANGYIPTPQNADSVETKTIYKELFKINEIISKNEFWKAQINQIYVNFEHEFELIPRVGNHSILINGSENLEEKLHNLFILYKNGLNKLGWNQYKSINLKFDNQIVCTKK